MTNPRVQPPQSIGSSINTIGTYAVTHTSTPGQRKCKLKWNTREHYECLWKGDLKSSTDHSILGRFVSQLRGKRTRA